MEMLSVSEAKKILQSQMLPEKIVEIAVADALNKILAADVTSDMDVPSFDNSAMDGYAVKYCPDSGERILAFTASAGDQPTGILKANEAARIYTGAMMPKGADTVIPQEFVNLAENKVCFQPDNFPLFANVRLKGTQCRRGDVVAHKFQKITPGMMALLLSCGVDKVKVFAPPLVGLLVTGDELVDVGTHLKPGQIYNTNGPAVSACLNMLGISQIDYVHVPDQREILMNKVAEKLKRCDILIFTGGISVGDRDYVKVCLEQLGCTELFYKLKQRPGKPMYCGRKDDKMVFALPGNPASVLSCMRQYVMPFAQQMMGHLNIWKPDAALPLQCDYRKKAGLTFFLKAMVIDDEVHTPGGQESFNLLPFGESDCFVELPEEADFVKKGTVVPVYFW